MSVEMTDMAVLAPPKRPPDADERATERREIRRRQTLPSGRAVVGGFLVALAALGILVAWANATRGPATRYLVATRDLTIGSRIAAADVRLETMELPASMAKNAAFADTRVVVGATVVGPVRKGELVQAGNVVATGDAPGELEVSFALDASRAVGGDLAPGEFVDLVATFGTGGETYTTTVVQGARVVDIGERRGSLTAEGARTVTLAVADATEARAVVHAANVGDVVLVRSGAPGDKPEQGAVYRAPAAEAESEE